MTCMSIAVSRRRDAKMRERTKYTDSTGSIYIARDGLVSGWKETPDTSTLANYRIAAIYCEMHKPSTTLTRVVYIQK